MSDTRCSVLIAIQAGDHYGYTHLARCQTLAHHLTQTFHADVTFWLDTPTPALRTTLTDAGLTLVESIWSLPEALRQQTYDRLVIDFQTPITPSLMQTIRNVAPNLPVTALDNHGHGIRHVNTLIFPNSHTKTDTLPEFHGTLYQGRDYTLLGSSFLFDDSASLDMGDTSSNAFIFISMGGRDPELLTEKILRTFSELEGYHIDVAVPPDYPVPEGLEAIATKMHSTITLHWKQPNIRPLMERATIAVVGFGMSVYELAYLGIPTLIIGHDDSDTESMEHFSHTGFGENLGWGGDLDTDTLNDAIQRLLNNPEQQAQMKQSGQALVDEQAPIRVVQAIMDASA